MMEELGEVLRGIYTVTCVKDSSQIKIKHLENVSLKNHEYISDTLIKDFKITSNVVGGIYACNITDIFLMTNKKLPVYYINVTYERPLKKYLLYRVYLCFTITSDIKTEKQLLHSKLDGKYTLEIIIDGQRREIGDPIEIYPGDDKMHEKFENFSKAEPMLDLTQSLVDEILAKLAEQSKKEFESMNPPTNIISLKNYKFDDDEDI